MPQDDPSMMRYARSIERRWSDLVERPVILSPRDWSRISRWHSWGVPLDLIDETLRSAARPDCEAWPRSRPQSRNRGRPLLVHE